MGMTMNEYLLNWRSVLRAQTSLQPQSVVRISCLSLAILGLGACSVLKPLPPPAVPYDYRDRHAVVMSEEPYAVDLFPEVSEGRIDRVTGGVLREFVDRYRRFGEGPVTLMAPRDAGRSTHIRQKISVVRSALASMGLSAAINEATYPIVDPALGTPIRLSFRSLKAKVSHRCGEWPDDLASGGSIEGWQNKSYWNFGCASQQTLAAQIADPRDLVQPRGETASDVEIRMRAIEALRKGDDPVTKWNEKATNISKVGASQ